MRLPENGRIVIVDDRISEAQPLIKILSKKRIPFNYYSGTDYNEFPDDNSLNKFRVLFLDLNIFEIALDEKSVISSINGILTKLIPDNPNPYLLVIWSKQEETYKQTLEEHFVNNLPLKSPAKIIFLKKGDYFDYMDGDWIAKEESITQIEQDLVKELNDISLLGNLIQWENIIHQKTNKTVNEFSSFYKTDNDWDKNLKAVMFNLAKSIIGNDEIDNLSNEVKLAIAFSNLSTFLFDEVENEIDENGLGTVSKISNNGITIPNNIISKINTKLHLSQKEFAIDSFEQGNLYFIDNQESLTERIVWDKKFKQKIRKEILETKPQLIQLDLTPVCDYSRNKDYVRAIFGVLLDIKYYENCANRLINYKTPSIEIEGKEKFIFLDFRFIKTYTKKEIKDRKIVPKLKLRKNICTDIQSQLANQINRPGINNL